MAPTSASMEEVGSQWRLVSMCRPRHARQGWSTINRGKTASGAAAWSTAAAFAAAAAWAVHDDEEGEDASEDGCNTWAEIADKTALASCA